MTTSTPGAVTFADFDSPVNPAYATIAGGTLNGGASPGGGGNWLCANGFGCGVVTINFTGLENYFGLLWGSQDGAQNVIRLFQGATQVGTVTAPGAGGIGDNDFVNIFASSPAESRSTTWP